MPKLQPILETILGHELVLPERKLRSIDTFIEMFPGVERAMIDGTERPIQRPQDAEAQAQNYSGKKRRDTRKQLAAVDPTKRVLVLSKAREGKLHDQRFEAEEEITFHIAGEISIEVDLRFQGL